MEPAIDGGARPGKSENQRACSSVGRASGLQPEGRRFESDQVHQLVQVNTRAYSSVWLERTPDKREVGGSNPPRPTSIELS